MKSKRIYIGNLHPAVDEYVLANTFSRYGKIAKMDYLFHKAGPLKGKPRGYAFIEYATIEVSRRDAKRYSQPKALADDAVAVVSSLLCGAHCKEAVNALTQTNGNTLRGRKLSVSYANAVSSAEVLPEDVSKLSDVHP